LPFDNIGDDPKWERFADGITEDIISDLSHSKDLTVIARNSTEVYKGKPIDVRQIGRELNVKYVLEGSIQSMGERIRVNAQLIEAASGSHVWSERYDRPVDDLFAVQNDVTQSIAATLSGYEGAVAEAERRLLRRKPPTSLTAFDTYLLAMEAKHKVTKEGLTEAEGLFRKALELDPQLARAYVGLVDVYFYLIDLGLAPSVEEARSKQMEAAENAVKLDPNDGKTHLALGITYAYHGKLEQAASEIARAETLAPSDADVLLIIAWTIPALGESERAVSLAERSLKLNPHYPDWYNQGLSYVFFFGEQYENSAKYRLLVKEPPSPRLRVPGHGLRVFGSHGRCRGGCRQRHEAGSNLDRGTISQRGRRLCGKGGRAVCRWCAKGRTIGLRTCRQAQGHAQSNPRQVLRPTARQDNWVTRARPATNYFKLGKLNSAPLRMPAGQRAVTVFSRV
jgi:TolB-like protein